MYAIMITVHNYIQISHPLGSGPEDWSYLDRETLQLSYLQDLSGLTLKSLIFKMDQHLIFPYNIHARSKIHSTKKRSWLINKFSLSFS